jgi:hypothetical protein
MLRFEDKFHNFTVLQPETFLIKFFNSKNILEKPEGEFPSLPPFPLKAPMIWTAMKYTFVRARQ